MKKSSSYLLCFLGKASILQETPLGVEQIIRGVCVLAFSQMPNAALACVRFLKMYVFL